MGSPTLRGWRPTPGRARTPLIPTPSSSGCRACKSGASGQPPFSNEVQGADPTSGRRYNSPMTQVVLVGFVALCTVGMFSAISVSVPTKLPSQSADS